MARTITLASGKGGVGKTTMAANLGIALAMRGQRTLLVDADIAMANLSLLLGMQNSPITLHEVLMGEAVIEDAIYIGPQGVELVPSGLSLESYRRADPERLRTVIENVENRYDYILLDAPAGIERNVMSALVSSQQVLLITQPNSSSIADALKTKIVTQRLQGHPVGVITNFVRGERGEIRKDEIVKILELPSYGEVPFDDEVRKTFLSRNAQPIIIRKPNSPASKAIHAIADRISGVKDVSKKSGGKGFLAWLLGLFKKKKKTEVT